MGYTTDFNGYVAFDKPLTEEQVEYLEKFRRTRHMKRDVYVLMEEFDKNLTAPGRTDYGVEGEFFVGSERLGVLDNNRPSTTQPGLWCQWVCDEDGLEWDGGEKFYNYVEWLQYMLTNFFIPWGVVCNGEIEWVGEDVTDLGKMVVKDNVLKVLEGNVVYTEKED